MFKDMQQFLSSDTCLACEGCCRFDKKESDWRPKAGASEVDLISASLRSLDEFSGKVIAEKKGYLKDKLCRGIYACMFFNPDDTTCAIYHERPFECRLYPFVLTLRGSKRSVCVHLPCPYIQKVKGTPKYDLYVVYLRKFFQEARVDELLKKNPFLFGEYRGYEDELEWVFDVGW